MAINKKDTPEEGVSLELGHSREMQDLSTLRIVIQDPRTRKKVVMALGWHNEIERDRLRIRPKGSQAYKGELVKP